jgi:hypothetical protein
VLCLFACARAQRASATRKHGREQRPTCPTAEVIDISTRNLIRSGLSAKNAILDLVVVVVVVVVVVI